MRREILSKQRCDDDRVEFSRTSRRCFRGAETDRRYGGRRAALKAQLQAAGRCTDKVVSHSCVPMEHKLMTCWRRFIKMSEISGTRNSTSSDSHTAHATDSQSGVGELVYERNLRLYFGGALCDRAVRALRFLSLGGLCVKHVGHRALSLESTACTWGKCSECGRAPWHRYWHGPAAGAVLSDPPLLGCRRFISLGPKRHFGAQGPRWLT